MLFPLNGITIARKDKEIKLLEEGGDLYVGLTHEGKLKNGYGTLFTKAGDKMYGYWYYNRFYRGECLLQESGSGSLKIMGTFPTGNLSDIYDANPVSGNIKWDREGEIFERQTIMKNDSGSGRDFFKNGSYYEGMFKKG